MYLKHLKFTLAVVLYILIIPLAKLTNRYEPMSFSDLKDAYLEIRDDIYFN